MGRSIFRSISFRTGVARVRPCRPLRCRLASSHSMLVAGISHENRFLLHHMASLTICFTRINRVLEVKTATD